MSVTLKPKNEITIPKSIRRKAGIKHGDRFDFSVSGRVISIIPKLSPDELEDERETRDPTVRRAIQESNADIAAGRTKPADQLLALMAARPRAIESPTSSPKRLSSTLVRRLKRADVANADRDLASATEWFPLEEEASTIRG